VASPFPTPIFQSATKSDLSCVVCGLAFEPSTQARVALGAGTSQTLLTSPAVHHAPLHLLIHRREWPRYVWWADPAIKCSSTLALRDISRTRPAASGLCEQANEMSQSQPYVYRPLDKSRREIRLITVLNIGRYPSLGWLQKFVNWRPPTDFLSLFAFSALVKRPYWRRVWIQQELQASENVWFHCGRKRIHLSLIGLVLGILHRMHSDRRGMDLGMIPRDSFETFLGTLHSDESMSIVRAAVAHHNTRSRNSSLALASLLKVTYIFRQGFGSV
jgi:hypothetical protein